MANKIIGNLWEVTLPTGSAGKPDVVTEPALDSLDNACFHVTTDGVVFNAPCNGVTTVNTKYPRSELREMTGAGKAGWDFKTGTHSMKFTAACTHLPAKKPQLVMGQVHGSADDIFEIRFTGSHLEVIHNTTVFGTLLTTYSLGTFIDVDIEIVSGDVTITVTGGTPVKFTPAASGNCYFKLGAYVQSNVATGDGSDYGAVIVKSVSVTHTGMTYAPTPTPKPKTTKPPAKKKEKESKKEDKKDKKGEK